MKRIFLGWKQMPFDRYVTALKALGAEVERDRPERCDALLLPGGGDLEPALYGQDLHGARDVDTARDSYELDLLRLFLSDRRPVLGICRGAQLINVAFGGTLLQHIDGHSSVGGKDRRHIVQTDDAFLLELYGSRFQVNSAHHQAADLLGTGLVPTAWAEDGIIEAFRHERLPVLAVQWHPERLGEAGLLLLQGYLGL